MTSAQLLELGFGEGAIKYRRKIGRLHLLHRGVYAVGHRPPSPLTTASTLLDLTDVLDDRRLTRAVNEAQVQRLVTAAELTALVTRYPGRRTSPLQPERGATRSQLEDDFVRFLKRHRLPMPELNPQIAGHEVDAVYRAQRLVIELDSRQFHTTPKAFEQDRDRDADLPNAGFSKLRITDQRFKQNATQEARRLIQILSRN